MSRATRHCDEGVGAPLRLTRQGVRCRSSERGQRRPATLQQGGSGALQIAGDDQSPEPVLCARLGRVPIPLRGLPAQRTSRSGRRRGRELRRYAWGTSRHPHTSLRRIFKLPLLAGFGESGDYGELHSRATAARVSAEEWERRAAPAVCHRAFPRTLGPIHPRRQ